MYIKKRKNSYLITVSCGYDTNGKHISRSTSFAVPKGLTAKQEQKAVLEFSEKFERKVKGGTVAHYNRMTFRTFCYEYYYKNHLESLKPKTSSGYKIVIEKRLIPYFV